MTDTTGTQGPGGTPAVPASAVWLKGQLLEIASALRPGRRPEVVREWTDPVRWRDPTPVGHRFLFLLCVSTDDRPTPPDDALNAFTAAGWTVRGQRSGPDGESWATAGREDFEVQVYTGAGRGITTFTGWTPVIYAAEQQLSQPPFTRSTAPGILCDDCHGWGICQECGGRAYSGGSGGYGRCWCTGNNAGPGRCAECGGTGLLTAEEVARMQRQHGDGDTSRQTPPEDGHDSNTSAFLTVSRRPCRCGEFRCSWRNTLSRSGDHRLSHFHGTCPTCAAARTLRFTLPLH
ncbi:hypothetical protein ACIRD8_05160 [Streptomyces sp. NPDC102451]|uniref:hypothetical protein n=1 Tax=Streptomyces sp. NPDC102451 TaxID=3366177 RepID=UPI0038148D60